MINKILELAVKEIGTKENPPNSNKVKYNTEYYGRAVSGAEYPWCCTFIWWLFKRCNASSLFFDGKKTAYCPAVETFYKSKKQWYAEGKPGDLVLFEFSRKNKMAEHIGIVEKVNSDGTYVCIEGNTGIGNNANGGEVLRRIRYKADIRGFARPNYQTDLTAINDIVRELHARGIISNKGLWLTKLKDNSPEYWLARKAVNVTENSDKPKSLESINDILWELKYRNIFTDIAYWEKSLENDEDVYWLARKICNLTENI